MKRVIASAVLWVLAAVAAPSARADQLQAGAIELSPKVSFSHSSMKREGYGNVDNFTQFDLAPSVGFCLNRRYQVNGAVLVRHEAVNGARATSLGALTGLTYNFTSQGAVIPFGGVAFGTLFNSGFTFDNTSVLAPVLSGGVRVLVGNAGSVNLSLGYEHETDGHVSVNRLVSAVGVSIFPWQVR